MPIEIEADIYRPTKDEFAQIAFDIMSVAFQIHNTIGRFFDEKIYKQVIAARYGSVRLEVMVKVVFEDFCKHYFLDMLVRNCALFEWKAADRLAQEHRGQLLNYLYLCDLPKGKLINSRPELIQHEFVNTTLRHEDRQAFRLDTKGFHPFDESDTLWQQFLVAAMLDWGSGLDIRLYEAAIKHVTGIHDPAAIEIIVDGQVVDHQKVRMTPSGAAYKVTSFSQYEATFELHAQRFLNHTRLVGLHWININRSVVQIKTLIPNPLNGRK